VREETETQLKSSEVPKNVRDFKLWMRGVITKKKEIGSAVA